MLHFGSSTRAFPTTLKVSHPDPAHSGEVMGMPPWVHQTFGTQGDGTIAVVCPQAVAFDSAACLK